MARIVMAGYLGCGNLGDDAVMLGVMDRLGDHDYTIMSGSPSESNQNFGIRAIDRRDARMTDSVIKESDAVVFPGGSIFQDVTSAKSTVYYNGIVKIAKKHGKKVLFLGQGVGPLKSWIARKQAFAAFSAADLITVRDPGSLTVLREIGIQKKVHLAADSAFLMTEPIRDGDEGKYQVGGMPSVALAPRPAIRKGVDVVTLFGETCRLLYQAGYAPNLIEMDSHEDGPLISAISKQQGGRIPEIKRLGTPRMSQLRFARMEAVIAMRLHAGILAATVGVPPIMISYDPKVTAFARQLDIGAALPLESLTPQRLFDSFRTHHKNMDKMRPIVEKKRIELLSEAMKSVELANEILR